MVAAELELHVTDRISALKEKFLDTKPTLCVERAGIYTEVYKTHEHEPIAVRRAIALAETLKRMTVRIDSGELIVGNQSSTLRAAPIFPEYAVAWILSELDEFANRPGDAFFPSEKAKAELRRILPYWNGKTLIEKGNALLSDEMRSIHDSGIIRAEGNLTSGDGHIAVDFPKILSLGIGAILNEVKERQRHTDISNQTGLRREQFYRAVIITLEAVSGFIRRFENLARSEASNHLGDLRAEELLQIAANCRTIALEPPATFYQALQLTYFVQLVLQIESNGHSVSLGRMDQYLFSFYAADLEQGTISRETAYELLQNTWIKLLGISKIRSWSHTRFSAGSPLYQNVTIGGQTPDGRDAVNGLSYLILDSVASLKLTQPNLSVRYHRGMSEDFMARCVDVIARGFGMPAFNNDQIVIPSLLKLGVEPADAYDYSAIGCIEVAVPGKWGYRCTGMSFLNLMRVLNCTLRNGYDLESDRTYCPGTGGLAEMSSFEQLMNAWDRQIRFYTRATVAIDTAVDTALEENVPDIFCSALVDDCLGRGVTIKEGGAKYDFVSGLQVGIANLGNSLAAIRKLVFEERRIDARELLAALESDFSGPEGEKLRQMLINRAPKYGNDDDAVDLPLRDAYFGFIDELSHYTNTRYGRGPIGGTYFAGTSSISANVPSGAAVGATPDGRKARTPLAEGCSPSSGTDRLGPTAVFKSVGKLPTEKITGGVLLNQKLSPAAIANSTDRQKLSSIMRTFFDTLNGWHVQYNIVSRDTLLAAQGNPAEYRDLVVRVAGYSAFFVSLARDTQDDIIARTEHTLG
ncbi:MAG TPA: glycyl radical protein [Spirochaetia bacterium]|nr:glycyl radical protein [Spirochaetia bacterium]